MIDGDGAFFASGFTYPSIGLKEPNLPAPGPIDMGDNQDAMDIVEPGTATAGAVYFSLDGGMFDGREGIPNSNAAAANGVGAADIFVQSGAGMTLWAGAPSLGLDLVAPLTDDIDALILTRQDEQRAAAGASRGRPSRSTSPACCCGGCRC